MLKSYIIKKIVIINFIFRMIKKLNKNIDRFISKLILNIWIIIFSGERISIFVLNGKLFYFYLWFLIFGYF